MQVEDLSVDALLSSSMKDYKNGSILWFVLSNYMTESFRLRLNRTNGITNRRTHFPAFIFEYLSQSWDAAPNVNRLIQKVTALTSFLRPVNLSGQNDMSVLLYHEGCGTESLGDLLYAIGSTTEKKEIVGTKSDPNSVIIYCKKGKDIDKIAYSIPLLQTRYKNSHPVLYRKQETEEGEWNNLRESLCKNASVRKWGAQMSDGYLVIWKPQRRYSVKSDEDKEIGKGIPFEGFCNWSVASLSAPVSRIGISCGRIGNIPVGEAFVSQILEGKIDGKQAESMTVSERLPLLSNALSSSPGEYAVALLTVENVIRDRALLVADLVVRYTKESRITSQADLRSAIVFARSVLANKEEASKEKHPWIEEIMEIEGRCEYLVGYVNSEGSPSFHDVDLLLQNFTEGQFRIPGESQDFAADFIQDVVEMDLSKLYARSIGANMVSPTREPFDAGSKAWYNSSSTVTSEFLSSVLGELDSLDSRTHGHPNISVCLNEEVEITLKPGTWEKGRVIETWEGKCIVELNDRGTRHTVTLEEIRSKKQKQEEKVQVGPPKNKMRGAPVPPPPLPSLPSTATQELPPIFVLDDTGRANSCVACRENGSSRKYVSTVYDEEERPVIISLCIECLGKIPEFQDKDPRKM